MNAPLPDRYVRVVQYWGKRNPLQALEQLYRVELVAEGVVKPFDAYQRLTNPMTAHAFAQGWGFFLGWPVFSAVEKVRSVTSLEQIEPIGAML